MPKPKNNEPVDSITIRGDKSVIDEIRKFVKNRINSDEWQFEKDILLETLINSPLKYITKKEWEKIKQDAIAKGLEPLHLLIQSYNDDKSDNDTTDAITDAIQGFYSAGNELIEDYLHRTSELLESLGNKINGLEKAAGEARNDISNEFSNISRDLLDISGRIPFINKCEISIDYSVPNAEYSIKPPHIIQNNDVSSKNTIPDDFRRNNFDYNFEKSQKMYEYGQWEERRRDLDESVCYFLGAALGNSADAQVSIAGFFYEVKSNDKSKSSLQVNLIVSLAWYYISVGAIDNKPTETNQIIAYKRIIEIQDSLDSHDIEKAKKLAKAWPLVYPWPRHPLDFLGRYDFEQFAKEYLPPRDYDPISDSIPALFSCK